MQLLRSLGENTMFSRMKYERSFQSVLCFVLLKKDTTPGKMFMQPLDALRLVDTL